MSLVVEWKWQGLGECWEQGAAADSLEQSHCWHCRLEDPQL